MAVLQVFDAPNAGGQGTHAMAYAEYGAADAPAILCVHGLTRNSRDFIPLAEALSANFRVIAVDVAGRGKSEWLADKMAYHYGTYLADLLALLAHLNLSSVGWIGTSMGGILGMMAAAHQPAILRWLVLNDVGARIPAAGLKRITAYAGNMQTYATHEAAEAELRRIGQSFGLQGESEWRQYIDATLEPAPQGGWRFACDPAILQPLKHQSEGFTKIEDVDLSAFWQAVTCPTLLLRGAESDILPKDLAASMANRDGVRLIEYPGVGHAPALLSSGQIGDVVGWFRNTELNKQE